MATALRQAALVLAFGLPLGLAAAPPPRSPLAVETKVEKKVEKKGEKKAEKGFASVAAQALADNPAKAWPAIQFVQADKQGRIVLLRSDTLELFALTAVGRLVPRGRLEEAEGQDEKGPWVEMAALSPAGDVWVTFRPPNRLEVFRGGKSAVRVESQWLVSSLAADDGPVVGVLPGEFELVTGEGSRLALPPLIKRWDGKRWETVVEGVVPEGRETSGAGSMEWLRGQYGTLIALAPNGQLWVADRNAFHLRHFTASGVLKDDLRVGAGEVAWSERSDEDYSRLEKAGAAAGYDFDRKKISPVVAKPLFRAMTPGRDGCIYLVVETSEGLALDRFDPSYPAYDRLLLTGVTLSTGRVTLAAGAHSLVLAPYAAKDGLWEISDEALEDAEWREVPDATLNGTPIPPRQPEPPSTNSSPAAPPPKS